MFLKLYPQRNVLTSTNLMGLPSLTNLGEGKYPTPIYSRGPATGGGAVESTGEVHPSTGSLKHRPSLSMSTFSLPPLLTTASLLEKPFIPTVPPTCYQAQ